jgi:hypothetical protein
MFFLSSPMLSSFISKHEMLKTCAWLCVVFLLSFL